MSDKYSDNRAHAVFDKQDRFVGLRARRGLVPVPDVVREPARASVPQATFQEVIAQRPAELGSWSWFWLVDTKKVPSIKKPLARWYVYFSPDHDTRGGVRLYYTDDLTRPQKWTLYRGGPHASAPSLIYEDLDDSATKDPTYSTETPSFVFDEVEGKLRQFYHCVNPSYGAGGATITNLTDPNGARSGTTAYTAGQGTMSALQADDVGVVFTKDRSFALDVFWSLGGHGYGDHTGYFVPFHVRGGWAAYHINGGSDAGAFGLSRAIGGDLGRWRSEKRQLGRYTHLFKEVGYPNSMVGWNNCSAVETAHGLKLIGSATTPASGLAQGSKLMFCASLADDLRTITGPVQIISKEPPGIPINWVQSDDGGLVGIYRTENTVGVCHVSF
jgi:hypothetical protein